ncbi:hypothetical protein vseg_020822 [Gypsophila vaccaria]
MAEISSHHNTYIPLPTTSGSCKNQEHDSFLSLVPIHIVTNASQFPKELRIPSPERQVVIGFDSEGVNLSRHGTLCILQIATSDAIYIVDAIKGGKDLMNACKPALESPYVTKVIHDCKRDSEALYFQFGIKLHNVVDTQIAYSLLQEQQGLGQSSDDGISFIRLLADRRFCGISYLEKKEVCSLLKQDPMYWTYRPFTEQMVHAAVDDFVVRYTVDVSAPLTTDFLIGLPSLLLQGTFLRMGKFRRTRYCLWSMFRLEEWVASLEKKALPSCTSNNHAKLKLSLEATEGLITKYLS